MKLIQQYPLCDLEMQLGKEEVGCDLSALRIFVTKQRGSLVASLRSILLLSPSTFRSSYRVSHQIFLLFKLTFRAEIFHSVNLIELLLLLFICSLYSYTTSNSMS
jgi:hypothetical protein